MAGRNRYSSQPDQAQENLARLRMYDAAQAQDQKQSNFEDRLDFQRQKEAFEQAYKTGEAERKASQFEESSNRKQQQLDIMTQRMQLQNEIAQNNDLLKQQAQLAKDKATVARQNAGMEFYKGVANLDPQSADFRSKFGDLMSRVQSNLVDSEGKIPDDVNKVADHLWSQHNTWAATNARSAAQSGPSNTTNALQDALAASNPIYGVADDKGLNFNATQAGKDAQTHVQTTYIPPGGKKPVTQVFPRDVFDSMVAASVARGQGSNQSTATETPTAPIPSATPPTTAPSATLDATTGEDQVQALTPPKLNALTDDLATRARAAISSGKDPDAVRQRLRDSGYDPSNL